MVMWLLFAASAFGGGGGQNILLVVNPNDEAALRIATAYQRLRAVPDSNIVFISPPTSYGLAKFDLSQTELINTYINPVATALADRGLTDQIDYIGVIGQASRYSATAAISADTRNSLTYALSLTTPLAAGLNSNDARYTTTALYQNPSSIPVDSNSAIHHSDTYEVTYPYAGATISTQYYMGGAIAYTGVLGNSPGQVIAQLERSVSGDGTKPEGTVYFEENDDIRSNIRESQWTATKDQLDARGVAWNEERNVSGSTPHNRSDVRGAVVGRATTTLPNGSTYLPGSWADNLTSYGATWSDRGQSKSTLFLASGAAATAGSVVEPYAVSARFTNSSIFTFIADGSTLGEAFFKSVSRPDIQMFIGDLLAQPYADLPVVELTSGPAEGATVNGAISLEARGSLASPTIATGIAQLELYVDGRLTDTVVNSSATFALDTTLLSDGCHQLQVVAINNAAAESEGYLLRNVVVDNHGRSVASSVTNLTLDSAQMAAVPVSVAAGDGSPSRVELRRLGSVLGQVSGAGGNIDLDASQLAYGENRVVPVAVFNDGTEVAGTPIVVQRNPSLLPGATPTPTEYRTPGIKGEYFLGQGQTTIAASEFDGAPDLVMLHGELNVFSGLTYLYNDELRNRTSLDRSPEAMATTDIDHLAARFSGCFEIDPSDSGEYEFFLWKTNDSAQLLIDGIEVLGFDNANGSLTPGWGSTVWLDAGEHELTLLTANIQTSTREDYFDVSLMYRGPDGITRLADSSFLYQIPEPATWLILGSGILLLAGCPRRRRNGTSGKQHRDYQHRRAVRESHSIHMFCS